MALSCWCSPYCDYYANPDDDFSAAKSDCTCQSCKREIKAGETVLKFTCWRHADEESDDPADIVASEDGDVVWLDDDFLCEQCGEIYMNLTALHYCINLNDYMPDLLREYQIMTGFKKEEECSN